MKGKFLTLALTLLAWTATLERAEAQVSRGTILAGGNAGLQIFSRDGNSDVVLQINPTLGFFVNDALAIGANLNLIFTDNLTQFGFGPLARYYFTPNVFGQAGFGFTSLKLGNFDADTSLYGNFGLGYSIFLNQNVALEPLLVFNFAEAQNVYGINLGFQVFLGR